MGDMTPKQILDAVENAKTKDELEEIGVNQLSVDIDKRHTKEQLRANLAEKAEDLIAAFPEEDGAPATDPATVNPDSTTAGKLENGGVTAPAHPGQQAFAEPVEHPGGTQAGEAPPVDDDEDGEDDSPAPTPRRARRLRNTQNGRIFPWTAALSALPHMQEA